MKTKIELMLVCTVLALCGCAPMPAPERQAQRDEIQRTIPTCADEKECSAKWESAQLWVVKNAGYKIQNATSVLIQTYNPTQTDVQLAAQVTKEPMGGGRYRFILKVWCNNIFGCSPNPDDATLNFNRTLNAIQM